jgi:hypothetical protein
MDSLLFRGPAFGSLPQEPTPKRLGAPEQKHWRTTPNTTHGHVAGSARLNGAAAGISRNANAMRLKTFLLDPLRHFIGHRESLPTVFLEPEGKVVGVDLKRDAIIAAARQEPSDVQFRESRNPKLSVLLDVDKLMEQEPIRKWDVRYHNITESDGGHPGEVRQVREAHARQHRVERRVLDSEAMQDQDPCRVERLRQEEASHCGPLRCGEGSRVRGEFIPLCADVLGDEAGDLLDLFRHQFRQDHLIHLCFPREGFATRTCRIPSHRGAASRD